MSKEILQNIIAEFSPDKFIKFFREKNRNFSTLSEDFTYYNDDNFNNGLKLGEIDFSDGQKMMVCAFRAEHHLSERTGKKAQYEKGKKILKDSQADAGIFIFYDEQGNFRFSLIYANYLGKSRDWNNFRRFTYFASKELTNKTFLRQIVECNFSSLEKIKDAFSVEKVTKEFYKDIANWYFWAVENCHFPKNAEEEENGRNIAIIRLITRMIFVWFMRERGLIPKELFDKRKISEILKNIEPNSSSYYQAILQNLFFATLNTKKEEREFRDEKRFNRGWNKDFGNQYVYRYQDFFAVPENMKDYFGDIPFLNGGLFECLDDGRNGVYIDGFTERKKEYQAEVPNFLFFNESEKTDLNSYYGTQNKTYRVQGLLNILSSFNFTIDENSLDDADIALDPELLGKVFENLLASFNPETSTTARKATGSYYTPRDIVDYMVSESLKEYFKTHLSEVKNIDEKINKLFAVEENENPFGDEESKELVRLLENVRIVDPAVGSGAFPMGLLNKMVFILNKIDPGNELWKQEQLKATDYIPDPNVRSIAKNQIEDFFKNKNADYGRKLYLIQKCIYGVDIQQIAVEIAKLRFFISLLVDEKIDKSKPNWDIQPLPNLDFKIMQGNSLISEFMGIDFDIDNGQKENAQFQFDFVTEDKDFIKEFEQKKIDFQDEPNKDKKAILKMEIENLLIKMLETRIRKQRADYSLELKEINKKSVLIPDNKIREEFIIKEKQKISKKTKFDLENIEKQLRDFINQNKIKPFFPWRLYFAEVFENGGFDIVIANPPYVSVKEIRQADKNIFSHNFETGRGRFNLFTLFLEKGNKILKNGGILTFILPEGLYSNVEYKYIRKYLLENTNILFINLFTKRVFDAAVNTSIISVKKNKESIREFPVIRDLKKEIIFLSQSFFDELPFYMYTVNLDNYSKHIVFKIFNSKMPLISNILEIQQGIIYSGQTKEKVFANNMKTQNYKKVLDGRDVLKWLINWENKRENKFIHYTDKLLRAREERLFLAKEKIILPRKSMKISCAYDNEQYYCLNTAYVCLLQNNNYKLKFILAILNSFLINFFYSKLFFGWQITIPALNCIGIPNISLSEQDKFIELVDKILSITKTTNYLDSSLKQSKVKEYEYEINQMVYKLYDIKPEEIKIIEGDLKQYSPKLN